MSTFLLENWQAIAMVAGGIVTFIFKIPISKWILKQNEADVRSTNVTTDTNTINNLERSMNIYIALIDDISKKIKEKDDIIQILTDQIHELKNQIEELTNRINEFINN
jgi:peptidoglycan hydrolase CwlO-like protein